MRELIDLLIKSKDKVPDNEILDQQTKIAQDIYDYASNNRGGKLFLLKAPTGFGKTETFIAPFFYSIINNNWFAGRAFIVDPIHSLLNQMNERLNKYVNALKPDALKSKIFIGEDHGEIINRTFLYTTIITLTTIDSFIYGYLAKRTLTWTSKGVETGRYSLPAGLIMNSYNIFDEAHLIQDEAYLGPRILSKSINSITKSGGIVLFSSATLPTKLMELFDQNNIIEYKSKLNKWKKAEIILHEETIDKIHDYINKDNCNSKTLIFVNSIERARKLYFSLKEKCGDNIVILHSLLRKKEKNDVLDKVKKNKKMLIATQAAEAGIDIDDFETVYTEISPIDSLIQRIGRVRKNDIEAHIFDVENSLPYLPDIIKNTKNVLEDLKDKSINLNDLDYIQSIVDQVYDKFIIEKLSEIGNAFYVESMEYIYNLHLYSYPPEQYLFLRPSFYVSLYIVDGNVDCKNINDLSDFINHSTKNNFSDYLIKYSISLLNSSNLERLRRLIDQWYKSFKILCWFENGVFNKKDENFYNNRDKEIDLLKTTLIVIQKDDLYDEAGINLEKINKLSSIEQESTSKSDKSKRKGKKREK
jgi:CRISPR-associated endonuclease/helicase Cas3